MKIKRISRSRGFSLTEAMVLSFVVAVLIAMILPAFTRPPVRHGCGQRVKCVNNEKQLGIAFRGFGIDNGAFPMQTPTTNASVTQPLP